MVDRDHYELPFQQCGTLAMISSRNTASSCSYVNQPAKAINHDLHYHH